MSLDLFYSGFKSVGVEIGKLYSKFLDDHDTIVNRNRRPLTPDAEKDNNKLDGSTNNSYSLRNLRKEFDGLKTNGRGHQEEHRKINREYLNRPLKASDRLKYFQNSNSELTRDVKRYERNDETFESMRNSRTLKESSSEQCLSQTNSLNNNQSECNDNQSTSTASTTTNATNRPALLTISTNCQDLTKPESAASPTESHDSVPQNIHPKLETFNWFEAVEREEIPDFTPNLNNSGGSNKFDTVSVASYSSNPASPQERISPRSRRNSLNRFRSDIYRQSTEDLHQNDKRPSRNNDSKQSQNYHQSWRNNTGGRHSPRNDPRNGYNNRENSNNNGRHNDGGGGSSSGNYNQKVEIISGNYNRRNLIRGGSVDGKGKEFTRTRHDSFNRRNQENDNFEHFQSYNRKTYSSRNKDNFHANNRTLPPRLQQKWQQQQARGADYKNDCDNPTRFNNRNNQSGNTNKGTMRDIFNQSPVHLKWN